MKPPECIICDKQFSPTKGGDLLYFTPTPDEKKEMERWDRDGLVGHPLNAEWFCKKHLKKAKQYLHLSISEALNTLRK
ncbi:MAG: hypothetical protein INQ03_12605 [Candidatus Heimdallarchaeota archaeon]|nr:hypothetical protein [Candidatus Heimdallarchaeota archaeon]